MTGASSGIGRAIAESLSANGASLWLLGRRVEGPRLPRACFVKTDLDRDHEVEQTAARLARDCERVDALIHSAGCIHPGPVAESGARELDQQYRVNFRSAWVLTQALLPALSRARGQVVFVNSTVGLRGKAGAAQYAATKHALRAFADSLREEVNPNGVRVLSLFLGRTATPMQEAVCQAEGAPYVPRDLMQPEDVASITLAALSLPPSAEVTEIRMRPGRKPRY
jgi:short-subunit dehydrogenase